MGTQLNAGRSGRSIMSEINVTPFVDVMLVLLIIFMVAAPMMVQGIDVKLPSVSAAPISAESERPVISITGEGKIYINDDEVTFGMFGSALSEKYHKCTDKQGVILRADEKVEYGFIAKVMGAIRDSGIEQIGMVTEPFSGNARNKVPAN